MPNLRASVMDTTGFARTSWRQRSFQVVVAVWALIAIVSVRRAPDFLFGWDSFGYYLYLPAAFIQNDPYVRDLSWVEQARAAHDASGTLYQVSTLPDGVRVIRYPIGLAVLWSPCFALGHVLAGVLGYPQDGYSPPYAWCVHGGMLLLLLAGLLALRKILVEFFGDGVAAVTIALLALGTNLLDQATAGLAMPHLPLFALYALLLLGTHRWKSSGSWSAATITAVVAGLMILIRPSEAVCLLLPLLWPFRREQGRVTVPVGTRWRQWAMIFSVLALIGMVQFSYWHAATGQWIVDSYNNPGEGLDLGRPHTLPFLFGFRKGWYIYTPLMLLATLGIPPLRRSSPQSFVAVLVFFLANLYVVSSWTCWWYAGSFSSRAMTGSQAVMALPLAALLHRLVRAARHWRWAIGALLAALTALNLFQHWQYAHGIIHSSRMTFAAWRATFGATTRPSGLEDELLVERSTTADQGEPDLARYKKVTLPDRYISIPHSDRDTLLTDSVTNVTARAFRIDREHPYTPAIRIPFDTITRADHAWLGTVWRVLPERVPIAANIVHHFTHEGGTYAYHTADPGAQELVAGEWNTVRTWYMTPEVRSGADELVLYFWSQDTIPILVIGPEITVYGPVARH